MSRLLLVTAALWTLAAVLSALDDHWLTTGVDTVLAVAYLLIWLNSRRD